MDVGGIISVSVYNLSVSYLEVLLNRLYLHLSSYLIGSVIYTVKLQTLKSE